MKQEIIDFKKYVCGQEIVVFSNEEADIFTNICSNIKPFERPDFISLVGDTLYIIEHFEFDSSQRKKGSSTLRKEIFRDDKNVDEYFKDHNKDDSYVGALYYKTSPEMYLKNLFSTFDEHYLKIDSYIEHCKEKYVFKNINIVFFIVDRTICGNYVEFNGSYYCASPFRSKEFEEFLKNKKKVDYILVSCEGNNNTQQTSFCSSKLLLTQKIEKVYFRQAMENHPKGMITVAYEKILPIVKKK